MLTKAVYVRGVTYQVPRYVYRCRHYDRWLVRVPGRGTKVFKDSTCDPDLRSPRKSFDAAVKHLHSMLRKPQRVGKQGEFGGISVELRVFHNRPDRIFFYIRATNPANIKERKSFYLGSDATGVSDARYNEMMRKAIQWRAQRIRENYLPLAA